MESKRMRMEFDDSFRDIPYGRSYAELYGFEPDSPVANLIDWIREEYRAKYGCDYRLIPHDDGSWEPVPGRSGTYGYAYLRLYAKRLVVKMRRPERKTAHAQA
jgi:hypothetical protein